MSIADRVFRGGFWMTTCGPTKTEFWRGLTYGVYALVYIVGLYVANLHAGIFKLPTIPIDILDTDARGCECNESISTSGQEDLCCCWNFGWYGSSIRILPQRLKNKTIEPTHSISTTPTIRTSSVRMMSFGPASIVWFVEFNMESPWRRSMFKVVSCTSTMKFAGPFHPEPHSSETPGVESTWGNWWSSLYLLIGRPWETLLFEKYSFMMFPLPL